MDRECAEFGSDRRVRYQSSISQISGFDQPADFAAAGAELAVYSSFVIEFALIGHALLFALQCLGWVQ